MYHISHITNSIFHSRTYILSNPGSDAVWLVDCGDIKPVLSLVGSKRVEGVLLTHAHFDHIYGLPALMEKFPEVAIYTNEWGKTALADAKQNMSHYHETPVRIECRNVQVVKEGDNVCGYVVLETPGHNPSSICYADGAVIFTGDSYIPGCKVVTNLPHGDRALSEESLARITAVSQGKTVYPGHSV